MFDKAIGLEEKALEYHRTASGPGHNETLRAMGELAVSLVNAGRIDEAIRLQEEMLARSNELLAGSDKVFTTDDDASGQGHSAEAELMSRMDNLAAFYHEAGRIGEAIKIYEYTLPRLVKQFGKEHLKTVPIMHNLAYCYASAGRGDQALAMQEEVLSIRRKLHPPEHPEILGAMHNLAMFYDLTGRSAEALAMGEEVLALRRKVLGADHPDTLKTMGNVAASYTDGGRQKEAVELQEEVAAGYRKVSGPEHPATLNAMMNLAVGYFRSGRLPEAVTLGEQSLADLRRVLPPNHPSLRGPMLSMADFYERAGREDDAAALRDELAALQPKPLPEAAVIATLIPPDAEWKWLHPTDGTDPAAADRDFHSTFFTAAYDDTSWNSGRDSADAAGGFGYGEGFKGVDIGRPDDPAHRRTAWFRHRFTVEKSHSHLEFRCRRDDGLILYLDGREILRDNLPSGPDASGLFATVPQAAANDDAVHRFAIPETLEPGEHLFAISLHNASPPSSDLHIGGMTLVETGPAPSAKHDTGENPPGSKPEKTAGR
jgi:tetratricopeptide (TPR) repeat protein